MWQAYRTVQLTLRFTALTCACVSGLTSSAVAKPTPSATACLNQTHSLGLSRVVEIDTSQGPRFGEQYPEENVFLEPGEVVLTFDDGPMRRLTKPILDVLDKHCVKATFFAVGRMAAADPAMLKEVDRRGHTIGSHTWSHKKLGRISQSRAKQEIELGISTLTAALGKPIAPFFRFPYLSDPKSAQTLMRRRGHGIFGIDVDSRDFKTRSGNVMRNRVLAGLKKKGRGIILFHDIQKSTARGLDSLLTALKARGYKVVHMTSKTAATTIAAYDKIAIKRIKRKNNAKKSNALADRAVTWPQASGTGANETDELPWLKNKVSKRVKRKPKPKPAPRQTDYESRWRITPFGR